MMVATVIIMLLTVLDVILRKFFNSPITGVMEYSQMLMVVILLGSASTAMNDGHIKIDVVYNRLPPKVKVVCDLITTALSFAISVIIASRAFKEGIDAITNNVRFLAVDVYKGPFYLLYSLGMFVLSLVLICIFIEKARGLKK